LIACHLRILAALPWCDIFMSIVILTTFILFPISYEYNVSKFAVTGSQVVRKKGKLLLVVNQFNVVMNTSMQAG